MFQAGAAGDEQIDTQFNEDGFKHGETVRSKDSEDIRGPENTEERKSSQSTEMERKQEEFIEFMNGFWEEYDTDGNGMLDKLEFKKFLDEVYFDDESQKSSSDDGKLKKTQTMSN